MTGYSYAVYPPGTSEPNKKNQPGVVMTLLSLKQPAQLTTAQPQMSSSNQARKSQASANKRHGSSAQKQLHEAATCAIYTRIVWNSITSAARI